MHNGMSALAFSAEVQEKYAKEGGSGPSGEAKAGPVVDPSAKPSKKEGSPLWITMVVAVLVAFAMFAALPHVLTLGLGWLLDSEALAGGRSLTFHAVDGLIKLSIFIGYLALISLMPDIKRTFEYHGAEHKSIHTYEHGQALTVQNAKKHTRLHPRCGTSFLLIVVLVAIVVFALLFPFFPAVHEAVWVNQVVFVLVKLVLLFPIGGIAYEVIKLSGRYPKSKLLFLLVVPGLMTQKITTREPDDAQLEVALASLQASIKAEEDLNAGRPPVYDEEPREFGSFETFVSHLEGVDVPETA